jgi:hypothetical protein
VKPLVGSAASTPWIWHGVRFLIRHFPAIARLCVTESHMLGSGVDTEAEIISVKKFAHGKKVGDDATLRAYR